MSQIMPNQSLKDPLVKYIVENDCSSEKYQDCSQDEDKYKYCDFLMGEYDCGAVICENHWQEHVRQHELGRLNHGI